MTAQEIDRIQCAIRHIQTAVDVDPWAVEIAVEALKKQVPKKPKVPIDTWVCPVCGRDVEYQVMLGENIIFGGQHDYCPKCGQAIDWSDEG